MKRIVLFASFLFLLFACSMDDVNDANDVVPYFKDFCPDNNHPHAIDMGDAGVWACCNVGANSPEEYGGYYAWGEIEEKSIYDWETYKYGDAYNKITKHCKDSEWGLNGFTDNKTELDLSDDVARQKWGGSWRMPSKEEFQKLFAICTSERTTINYISGRVFTAPNGSHLFFPASGNRNGVLLNGIDSYGDYWSRTLSAEFQSNAYCLDVFSGYADDDRLRCVGYSVRPMLLNEEE